MDYKELFLSLPNQGTSSGGGHGEYLSDLKANPSVQQPSPGAVAPGQPADYNAMFKAVPDQAISDIEIDTSKSAFGSDLKIGIKQGLSDLVTGISNKLPGPRIGDGDISDAGSVSLAEGGGSRTPQAPRQVKGYTGNTTQKVSRAVTSYGIPTLATLPFGGGLGLLGRIGANAVGAAAVEGVQPGSGNESIGTAAGVGGAATLALSGLGALGGLAGKAVRAVNKMRGSKSTIEKEILEEVLTSPETRVAYTKAKEAGLQLTPDEAANSSSLRAARSKIGATEDTARQIDRFNIQRDAGVSRSVQNLGAQISPSKSLDDTYKGVREWAARQHATQMKTLADRARPFYDEAKPIKIPAKKLDEFLEKPLIAHAYKAMDNDPVLATLLADSKRGTLGKFDAIKKAFDKKASSTLDSAEREAYSTTAKYLRTELDRISPAYAKARKIYEHGLTDVNNLDQSVLGIISKYDPKQYGSIGEKIFRQKNVNLSELRKVRDRMVGDPEGEKLFYDMTKKYLNDSLDSISDRILSGDKAASVYKTLFGTPNKRKILMTALKNKPEAVRSVSNLAKTLDRMKRIGVRGEKDLKGEDAYEVTKMATRTIGRIISGKHYQTLTDIFLDPAMADKVAAFNKATPGSRKSIQALESILSIGAGTSAAAGVR